MRVVVALGGNALARRGEGLDFEVLRRNTAAAARALRPVLEEHQVVLTHGNGPQVGLLALQSEAYRDVAPYPLDVLDAESEGMIGYLLQQALQNELPERQFVTLLTQVVVERADPAFTHPAKPIGPQYPVEDAERVARERGWTMAGDEGAARRVVASPQPLAVVEIAPITVLMVAGIIPICVGGGGIPAARSPDGSLHGVEAVVDKDLAAALLAQSLRADVLALLTDVTAVELGHGSPEAHPLREATPSLLDSLELPAGSMRPKADAASRFVRATGARAAIGALADAAAVVAGRSGTQVRADA